MLGGVGNVVSFACSACIKGKHVLGTLFHLAVGNEYFGPNDRASIDFSSL